MTTEKLIAALQTAIPDRVWDSEIAIQLLPPGKRRRVEKGADTILRVLPYTSSLDAALTLIPKGMWWHIGAGRMRPDEPLYGAVILWTGKKPQPPYACDAVGQGEHPTSQAIALCIAALKARELTGSLAPKTQSDDGA